MDAKATWGAGNYAAVAERIGEVGEVLVERAAIDPGAEVLDVATGTGNVALPAARAGARVTGLDLVPELLAIARERAADAMVEQVDWIEGDAEQLPFEDDAFDRVLSAFGCMFAPDHARAAAEMLRVCRPGGAIGMCNWVPDGPTGGLYTRVARFTGAADPAPNEWGDEDHVRELLDGPAKSLELERRSVTLHDSSPEAYMDFMESSFGPFVGMRESLGERWAELREELLAVFREENRADGGFEFEQEYLLVVARL